MQTPETGTVFRITSSRPITGADVFTLTAPSVLTSPAIVRVSAQRVNVYPNLSYAGSSYTEEDPRYYLTFNNLPHRATIRIFNLAGH